LNGSGLSSGEIDEFVNIYFVRVLKENSTICHCLQQWTGGMQREIISGGPEACKGKLFLVDQRPAEGNYFCRREHRFH